MSRINEKPRKEKEKRKKRKKNKMEIHDYRSHYKNYKSSEKLNNHPMRQIQKETAQRLTRSQKRLTKKRNMSFSTHRDDLRT